MHPVIQVRNLSKCYRIGTRARATRNFRESIMETLLSPLRNLKRIRNQTRFENGDAGLYYGNGAESDVIWALRGVSFDVQQGEVLGIVGRNGAGKSTLLKVLSRITEPTSGEAKIYGRIASLLEAGSGFHPDLTGRENIYLNGTILGMRKAEVNRKFDKIVEFSEIEKFLDTPVKYYSSGMYVRLAFAVAAHLESEILVVDEVLAVGDAAFQKKCLGKMGEVEKEGRTILFVSHNTGTVSSLCNQGLFLDNGEAIFKGMTRECIGHYLKSTASNDESHTVHLDKPTNAPIWMESITIICNSTPSDCLVAGEELSFKVTFQSEETLRSPKVTYIISSVDGVPLINASNRYQPSSDFPTSVSSGTVYCHLGAVPFMEGSYTVSFSLGDELRDWHIAENALTFRVFGNDVWGTGRLPKPNSSYFWHPTVFEPAI